MLDIAFCYFTWKCASSNPNKKYRNVILYVIGEYLIYLAYGILIKKFLISKIPLDVDMNG